jgi:hypothetical protein
MVRSRTLNGEEQMKNDAPESGSFSGLAKRWLKTQLKFHGDPHKAARDRREAEAIEHEARERAEYESGRALLNVVLPNSWREKLKTFEAQSELAQRQHHERERAALAARPRASLDLRFSGSIEAELIAEVPVDVSWPMSNGSWVVLSFETIDPIEFGGNSFDGMRIALPADDAEAGRAINLEDAVARYEHDWDALDAQVWLDGSDSSFYWDAEGAATEFRPAPGLSSFDLNFHLRDEIGRRIRIEGRIQIPGGAHHADTETRHDIQ